MKKFLKKSDKGFSLVELIVVICIMAVLIGVVAPAFLKYVGKSKDSVVRQNVEELQRASNIVLAEEEFGAPTTDIVITVEDGRAELTTGNDTNAGNFLELLTESLGGDDRFPNDGNTYTITVVNGGRSVVVDSDALPSPTPTATEAAPAPVPTP